MAKAMTPSENSIAAGQIGKLQELVGARLRKSALQSEAVQTVVANQVDAVADEMVAALRKRVEAQSEIIIRRVRVDRSCSPQEVIDATRRNKYVDDDVVATMPKGEGDEVDVHFVPTKRFVPVKEVSAFLAQYGLVPDPRAQAAVNEADPAFADKYPNGSQWGDNCCLAFRRWFGKRDVSCGHCDDDWRDRWF